MIKYGQLQARYSYILHTAREIKLSRFHDILLSHKCFMLNSLLVIILKEAATMKVYLFSILTVKVSPHVLPYTVTETFSSIILVHVCSYYYLLFMIGIGSHYKYGCMDRCLVRTRVLYMRMIISILFCSCYNNCSFN